MNSAILQIALSSFRARIKRVVLNILLMTTATAGLMTMAGFGLFTYVSLEERSARETGHLVVSSPDRFEKIEDTIMQQGIGDVDSLLQEIQGLPEVERVLPVIEFQGLVASDKKSLAYLGRGVHPKEFAVRAAFIELVDGRTLSRKHDPAGDPEAVLGVDLAKNLGAKVGDYLTVLSNTVDESLNGFDVELVGVVKTGIPELDSRTFFTHYQSAQELLATDKIHQVGVYLEDGNQLPQAKDKLSGMFAGLKITEWEELAFFYQGVKNLYNNIFTFIGGITLVIVFFAMFNLISTAIWERTREFGVVSAMGMTPREIMLSLLLESALIAVLAIVFSTILYAGISLFLLFGNFAMAPPPGQTSAYPLQVNFSWTLVWSISLITFITVQVSTYFASRKINKLSITQALMHL